LISWESKKQNVVEEEYKFIINLNDQLANIFTKSLWESRIDYTFNKLGMYDLYVST